MYMPLWNYRVDHVKIDLPHPKDSQAFGNAERNHGIKISGSTLQPRNDTHWCLVCLITPPPRHGLMFWYCSSLNYLQLFLQRIDFTALRMI